MQVFSCLHISLATYLSATWSVLHLIYIFSWCNRLKVLNDRIILDWLNLSLTSYKLKMKEILLSNYWLLKKILTRMTIIFLQCKFYPFTMKINLSNSNSNQNRKFTGNTDLKKQDFLSEEKLSDRSRFVNKNVSQSWFNKNCNL